MHKPMSALAVTLACAVTPAAADGTITIIDVPGATETAAYDINAAGVVTGTWYDGTTNHGFIFTP